MAKTKGIESIRKKLKRLDETTASPEQIRNVAGYLWKSLHNAPNHRPPKRKKKLPAQNKVYFPGKNGTWEDSGMTVAEYMKHIKGAYRAVGHGTRNVRKYANPDKPNMPGVRAFPWQEIEKTRRTQGNDAARKLYERMSRKTALRGTGKVGKKEYEKLERLQQRRAKILSRSTASIRSLEYTLKAAEEVRKAEIETNRQLHVSRKVRGEQRKAHSERMTKMRRDLRLKKEIQRIKNQDAAAAFDAKNRRYRIVVPSSRGGYVAEMMPQTLVVPGAPAGKPPYTRERPGEYSKFLARGWKVQQRGKAYIVWLKPGNFRTSSHTFLKHLEYGGTEESSPIIVGYRIEFRDEDAKGRRFKHRRIAIRPLIVRPGMATIAAHPFVHPTVAKVQKKLLTRNGAKEILNYKGE